MKVYVKTPARLHLGLIDLNGDLGRIFGGLGVGIDHPNVILEAQPCERFAVAGNKKNLVKTLTKRFLETYNIKAKVSIQVKQTIPEHVGLGSGTQLALALATALAKIFSIEASIQELAIVMGRGRRTGVGTAIFDQGGLVIDGGKTMKNRSCITDKFPSLIFCRPFPKEWCFVLAIPNVKKGLADETETLAFRQSRPMSAEESGKICRLIIMKLLPSFVERDIKNFGDALTKIQTIVGECFSSIQGGTYSSLTVREGIKYMQKLGAYGVGQSSWGPTFYGLFQKESAKEIQLKIQDFIKESVGGQVFIAKANNRGAYIKVTKE